MRRISSQQWITIVFLLLALNCLVAVFFAWLVLTESDTVPGEADVTTEPSGWTPTPEPTHTATETPTPTHTPTPTAYIIYATATFTLVPLYTPTPTWAMTPTTAPSLTSTPTGTPIPVPVATRTPTPPPSPTPSIVPTQSPTQAAIGTATAGGRTTPPAARAPVLTHVPVIRPPTSTPDSARLSLWVASRGENAVTLRWSSVPSASYTAFGDMGTGFGLLIRKQHLQTGVYTDTGLMAGTFYMYLITETGPDVKGVAPRSGTLIARTRGEPELPRVSWNMAAPTAELIPTRQEAAAPTAVGTLLPSKATGAPLSPRATPIRPAPTPLPPDVVLLSLMNVTDHRDESDNIVIVGEIRNDSLQNATDAQITVTFYNARGEIIHREIARPLLSLIQAGKKAPFVFAVPEPENLWDWSLQAVGRHTSKDLPSTLSIQDSKAYEDGSGFYHVTGTVRNDGERAVSLAQVVVTLYDRLGRPINAGFVYTDPYSIKPGAEGTFDSSFNYYPQVKNYSVQIEWD